MNTKRSTYIKNKRKRRKKINFIFTISAMLIFIFVFIFAIINANNNSDELQPNNESDETSGEDSDEVINNTDEIEILPQSIIIKDPPAKIIAGDIIPIVAIIEPADATDKTIIYSSDDESVAIIDKKGNIAALKYGNVTIKAETANGLSASCTIKIRETAINVKIITLKLPKESLNAGEKLKVTYTLTPSNSDDTSLTWSSSDKAVAIVDAEGNITGISEGTVKITASASSGVKESVELTINPVILPSEITLNKT
ncbi:MAG: carbohydrate-binding protein, partial [Clostridia bacterium]|nr:carbohydrate-binding protein [Clostridia bacterium]